MAAPGHLLFVSKPTGYELRERDGDAPEVGSTVELDEGASYWVSRVGPSPRPGDSRQCAYLQHTR
ncbi:MAG: hypothetical protein M3229_03010 [Actinomycetota bacterium]|nr:hypothetical protein [Actinomycetota bacterium]